MRRDQFRGIRPTLERLREGSMTSRFAHIGSFRSVDSFQAHLREHNIAIPCDRELLHGPESPLGRKLYSGPFQIGNRFAVQPMEGWDGIKDAQANSHFSAGATSGAAARS